MAIDFSQVKTITIPEGEVNKITDSTGNILWKKAPSWHTIWEGNVILENSENSNSYKEVATLNALSGTVTLRVTWYSTASGGNYYDTMYYNNNGSKTTSTKPANPFQFDLDTASSRNYIVGCTRLASNTGLLQYNRGRRCYLYWGSTYKSFWLESGVGENGADGVRLSMTITKIEQYS